MSRSIEDYSKSFEEAHPRLAAAYGAAMWLGFAALEVRQARKALREDDSREVAKAGVALLVSGAVVAGVLVRGSGIEQPVQPE